MTAVACYIRVSQYSPSQTKQRRAINRWLKENGFDPKRVKAYVDKATAGHPNQPRLKKLKAAIAKGEFDMVVVWHLDRLSTKLRDGIVTLAEWCQYPLRIVSVDQQIELKGKKDNRVRKILAAVLDMGQGLMSERIKAGLKVARARGRSGGRPKLDPNSPKVLEAKKLYAERTKARLKAARARGRSGGCPKLDSKSPKVLEVNKLHSERTKAGLKAARARGRVGGRSKLDPKSPKVLEAKKLHKDVTIEIDEICNRLNISRSTLYRYLEV